MESIHKALWYIERNFANRLALEDIARRAGLSRFHFSRAFAQVTGVPVLTYVRGRRLSVAAQALADGAPDILTVALGAGYRSHEAFTRAFREMFDMTPEAVRARGSTASLQLLEPIELPDLASINLPNPAFREEGPFLMAGLREFRTDEERAGIPEQWQRFAPHIGCTPGEIGSGAYGICLTSSRKTGGFDYMTAVAIRAVDGLAEGLSAVHVARRCYAVFRHEDHVSKLAATGARIFAEWQPCAKVETQTSPLILIERYTTAFDPKTGYGGMELWIPLKH